MGPSAWQLQQGTLKMPFVPPSHPVHCQVLSFPLPASGIWPLRAASTPEGSAGTWLAQGSPHTTCPPLRSPLFQADVRPCRTQHFGDDWCLVHPMPSPARASCVLSYLLSYRQSLQHTRGFLAYTVCPDLGTASEGRNMTQPSSFILNRCSRTATCS